MRGILENRLKMIERKQLQEETKTDQLQWIQKHLKKRDLKQTYSYSATIVLFVALLFVFIQTLNTDLPKQSQSMQNADTFEMGELKKATYLYTQQPEKNYDLTSPFYVKKLTTTNSETLSNFQKLLNNGELKPFTRNITELSNATNYLFELKNGETIYLKSFEVEDRLVLIDLSTMMEIVLPYETMQHFATKWAFVYLENDKFPKWKMVLIVTSLVCAFLYEKRFRIFGIGKEEPKKSVWINFMVIPMWAIMSYVSQQWIGTMHLLFILSAVSVSFIICELLYKLFRIKQINWKELILRLTLVNFLMIILFVY